MNTATKETMGFQTEVRQLLDLMIHSLYSNKEIFLRELVSNASDACDKLRFEALTDKDLFENDAELKIRVSFDKAARTVTIADSGIALATCSTLPALACITAHGDGSARRGHSPRRRYAAGRQGPTVATRPTLPTGSLGGLASPRRAGHGQGTEDNQGQGP